jgi:hypothetical protein
MINGLDSLKVTVIAKDSVLYDNSFWGSTEDLSRRGESCRSSCCKRQEPGHHNRMLPCRNCEYLSARP